MIKKLLSYFRSLIARQLNLIYPPREIRIFCPDSTGSRSQIAGLTALGARQTLPLLAELSEQLHGVNSIFSIDEFRSVISGPQINNAQQLKALLDQYQSDKALYHDYHLVYAAIFQQQRPFTGLLEIGLGTNDPAYASNMGKNGKPGASLSAFRDFLPEVNIYGADIDRTILFEDDRITTFYADQTDYNTLLALDNLLVQDVQIIIDDGLHAPNTNLATLLYGLHLLRHQQSGWIVIEDIPSRALPLWKSVSALMSDHALNPYLIKTRHAYLFVVHKSI